MSPLLGAPDASRRGTLWPHHALAMRGIGLAAAEVGDQNLWQRAQLGFAAVSSSQQHTTEVIDEVSRFVWSFPEISVLDEERTWLS